MAIDYEKTLTTIDQMIEKLQTMRNAVLKHKRPFIKVDAENVIAYTSEQKQGIIAVYGISKAELANLVKQLPEA